MDGKNSKNSTILPRMKVTIVFDLNIPLLLGSEDPRSILHNVHSLFTYQVSTIMAKRHHGFSYPPKFVCFGFIVHNAKPRNPSYVKKFQCVRKLWKILRIFQKSNLKTSTQVSLYNFLQFFALKLNQKG